MLPLRRMITVDYPSSIPTTICSMPRVLSGGCFLIGRGLQLSWLQLFVTYFPQSTRLVGRRHSSIWYSPIRPTQCTPRGGPSEGSPTHVPICRLPWWGWCGGGKTTVLSHVPTLYESTKKGILHDKKDCLHPFPRTEVVRNVPFPLPRLCQTEVETVRKDKDEVGDDWDSHSRGDLGRLFRSQTGGSPGEEPDDSVPEEPVQREGES